MRRSPIGCWLPTAGDACLACAAAARTAFAGALQPTLQPAIQLQDGTAYSGDYEKDNTGFNACGFGDLSDQWEKCECRAPAAPGR